LQSFNKLAAGRTALDGSLRRRHECPGFALEMLIEAHFRTIFAASRRVVFGQHVARRAVHFGRKTMLNSRRTTWRTLALTVLAVFAPAGASWGEPAFTCSFDGPDTYWQVLENGATSAVLAHGCLAGGARDNRGFERVIVAAGAGKSVWLGCSTPPLAVLDELRVRMWVKSPRRGIQLAAHVKLPRSIDSQHGGVATTIVKDATYTRPGHWQELVLAEVPKLLSAQVRVLRATPGTAAIDAREAYIDSIVLVVPGDPSGIQIGTDQLEVEGVIVTPSHDSVLTDSEIGARVAGIADPASRSQSRVIQTGFTDDRTQLSERTSPVRLQGTTLMVEGQPFLARAIQWNGESLKFLSERGFNVVQLHEPPTPEQIAEATRLTLWFISTPPRPEAIARDGLGSRGDRVLAWRLEDEAFAADPNYAARWAELIRERDAVYGRPILIRPEANWSAVSKAADVLVARHPRICTLPASDYAEWLASRPRLARPGTPLWCELPTQFGEAVRVQANSLMHAAAPALIVDATQLESLVRAAGTAGARGFAFQSGSSLSETDAATRTRATVLELVNRRLQLMEPWLAGGKIVSSVTSTDGRVTASEMYVDRARLLIPVAKYQAGQGEPAAKGPPTKETTFVVPGVAESSHAYFITPVSMRSLASERIAGGTRISAPTSSDGLVVITEDPKVVQSLRQHIARHGTQTLRLERDLAFERVKTVFQTEQRLAQLSFKLNLSAGDVTAANARLAQLDVLMNSGQVEQAHELVCTAAEDFQRIVAQQERAVGLDTGLQSSALGLTLDQFADFAALVRSLDDLRSGENLLSGGDFEDLAEMTKAGWQHVVHEGADAATHAELSPIGPQHGSYALELRAAAPNQLPLSPAEPLVWIVSPPIPVDAEKIVEITGWVRIEQPFGSPSGGLAIVDTLGGPELSIVVRETSGWQAFRMLRAVPKATEFRLSFALTGIGRAKVDAVMVRTLEPPVPRRLPDVAGAAGEPGSTQK
jgi:hypothetical protein